MTVSRYMELCHSELKKLPGHGDTELIFGVHDNFVIIVVSFTDQSYRWVYTPDVSKVQERSIKGHVEMVLNGDKRKTSGQLLHYLEDRFTFHTEGHMAFTNLWRQFQ